MSEINDFHQQFRDDQTMVSYPTWRTAAVLNSVTTNNAKDGVASYKPMSMTNLVMVPVCKVHIRLSSHFTSSSYRRPGEELSQ